jgi:hypothetical protein
LLEGTILTHEPDTIRWALESNGQFSTASLYRELLFPGVKNRWMMEIWEAKLPLKIRIFLWQVCNDRIQSAEQLIKRNWPGSIACKMCGRDETTDHIIFGCSVAIFLWSLGRDVFGWNAIPSGVSNFQDDFLDPAGPKPRRILMFFFACVAWCL